MGLGVAELERVRQQDMKRARLLGTDSRRFGRSGRETLRVSREAYFNALDVNGGVGANGKTVWDDPEFVSDMKRRHPHIAVNNRNDGFVSLVTGDGEGAPRNRFGRVKERIMFKDGRKVVIKY